MDHPFLRNASLLLALCSFLFVEVGGSQPLTPRIEAYPPSDFGGHPQIFCAEYDQKGGAWFGTSNAVLHYNGASWEEVPVKLGLSIFSMEIDDRGRIWIGGNSEFAYLRPSPLKVPDEEGKRAKKGRNGSGRTSVKTSSGKGLRPGQLEQVSLMPLLADSLKGFGTIRNIHAHEGKRVFSSYDAIFVLRGANGKDSADHDPRAGSEKEASLRISTLLPRDKFFHTHKVGGEIWVQEFSHGFYRIAWGQGSGKNVKDSLVKLPGSHRFSDMKTRSVLGDVPGVADGSMKLSSLLGGTGFIVITTDHPGGANGERIVPFGKRSWPELMEAELTHATSLDPTKGPYGASLALSTLKDGVFLLDSLGSIVLHLGRSNGMTSDFIWETVHGAKGSGALWSATDQGVTHWFPGDPRSYAREGRDLSSGVNDIIRYKGQLFIATPKGTYIQRKGAPGDPTNWHLIEEAGPQCSDLLKVHLKESGEERLLLSGEGLFEIRSKRMNGGEERWTAHQVSKTGAFAISVLSAALERTWMAMGGQNGFTLISRSDNEWEEEVRILDPPEGVLSFTSTSLQKGKEVLLWGGVPKQRGFPAPFR